MSVRGFYPAEETIFDTNNNKDIFGYHFSEVNPWSRREYVSNAGG